MAAFKLSDDDQLIAKIEETTVDATRHQLDTLRQILQRNATVGYLRRHLDQSAAVDADNFRRIVPLSTYDDYADYINKIADGMFDDGDEGRHFLSFDPLLCFFLRFFSPLFLLLCFFLFCNYGFSEGVRKHDEFQFKRKEKELLLCIAITGGLQ
uniref:Uncharacterized protein n=1 Tax=Opuntia streptacantha TaxID=393608 RepID=A0A7C9CKF0_OPUST